MIDLNNQLVPTGIGAGVYLRRGLAINDDGAILALGSDFHYYLLTPRDE